MNAGIQCSKCSGWIEGPLQPGSWQCPHCDWHFTVRTSATLPSAPRTDVPSAPQPFVIHVATGPATTKHTVRKSTQYSVLPKSVMWCTGGIVFIILVWYALWSIEYSRFKRDVNEAMSEASDDLSKALSGYEPVSGEMRTSAISHATSSARRRQFSAISQEATVQRSMSDRTKYVVHGVARGKGGKTEKVLIEFRVATFGNTQQWEELDFSRED